MTLLQRKSTLLTSSGADWVWEQPPPKPELLPQAAPLTERPIQCITSAPLTERPCWRTDTDPCPHLRSGAQPEARRGRTWTWRRPAWAGTSGRHRDGGSSLDPASRTGPSAGGRSYPTAREECTCTHTHTQHTHTRTRTHSTHTHARTHSTHYSHRKLGQSTSAHE